jgi:iron complex outermembrane recepter protein
MLLILVAILLPQPLSAAAETTPALTTHADAERIVVTATRQPLPWQRSPGAVEVVDVSPSAAATDLAELLRGVPGIHIQQRHNYAQDTQLSMRGFGARASFGIRGIRLFVDDIPVTLADGQAQGALLPLAVIRQMEVMRGPWAVAYGNAAGGVITATTRNHSHSEKYAKSAIVLAFQTLLAENAFQMDTLSFRSTSGVVSHQQLVNQGFRSHSAAKRAQTYANLDIVSRENLRWSLTANVIEQPDSRDPLGLTREQFVADASQAGSNAILFQTRKSIRHQQLGSVLVASVGALEAKWILHGGQRDVLQYLATPIAVQASPTSAGGVIDLARRFQGTGVRLSSKDAHSAGLTWTIGADIEVANDKRRGYENFQRTAQGATILGQRGMLRRDEQNMQQSRDLFAHIGWELARVAAASTTLHAALRRSQLHFDVTDYYLRPGNPDDSGARRFAAWSPVMGITHTIENKGLRHSLHASIGRGFETPTATEMAYRQDQQSGLNLTLAAVKSRQWELGYRLQTAATRLQAALFNIHSQNDIVAAATVAGRSSFTNATGTQRRGLEIAADGVLTTTAPDWRWRLQWTHLQARVSEDYSANRRRILQGNRLPAVPAHHGTAALNWRSGKAGASAALLAEVRSRLYADDANLAAAAGYVLLHANVQYRFMMLPTSMLKRLELDALLGIDNLLNRKVISSVIVNDANLRFFEPGAPRRAKLGLRLALTF